MITRAQCRNILSKFGNIHVLVVGDVMLDVYLKGHSTRLTPEAPVPVVDITERRSMLGGAGNTVCNLIQLGARATVCSVIGDDEAGKEVALLFRQLSADTSGIVTSANRTSLSKTRVTSGSHVVARYDVGDKDPISQTSEESIIRFLKATFKHYDAVILSDYDKGVITNPVVEIIELLRQQYQKPIAVDSKRLSFFKNLKASLTKPNYEEAVALLNLPKLKKNRAAQISAEKNNFFDVVHSKVIAVTLDSEGSLFFTTDEASTHQPAPPVPHPYVSGAGDTFLSSATLALLTTGDIGIAQDIATAAASIAVSKENTATCTPEELLHFYPTETKAILSAEELRLQCEIYRRQGKKIVLTNGCFDILHSGHVTYLHCAKELGDILIVGMNDDESIKRLKGNDRPINLLEERMKVISGLLSVDHVVAFGSELDDTPIPLVRIIQPDFFVKGGDYSVGQLPEANAVEECGGKIVFIPFIPNHSTTSIIEKIAKKSHESTKVERR